MPLNKILEINYTYGSLTQPMAKEILRRVKKFISQIMDDRGDYSEQINDEQKEKYLAK